MIAALLPHSCAVICSLTDTIPHFDHHRYPSGKSSPSASIYDEETETESKPLVALPLASFFAQGTAEITWSIQGVLPSEGAGIVAGPAGYGKSWMLQDLAVEHARGGKWLGQFATAQGRVLYLDEESSPVLLRHRLTRLLAAKGLSADQLDLHLAVGQGLSFSNPASIEQLRRLLDQLRPALVIVDSLIRVHRAEENSASEMAQVFKAVKDLIREFGCTFLFADHQRKPGHFGASLDLLLRGSSEKAAFVDTLLSLQRKEGTLIVEHSKSRYAEPIPAFVVRIEDTGMEATAVVYGGEAEQIKQAARQEAAREFLVTTLSHGDWIARKDLVEQAKEAGVSEKALDEVLKAPDGLQIEREDRKPETGGRSGKAAYYRLMNPETSSPSLFPVPATET
ncbi:MAG: AAA family ATPase [Candidatus Omnitrophica bacterium]|nr:AAA family ATPase [Candidatus Omnitrophota bacterium]